MKELLKKYLIFVIGLYFLAAGIVLIIPFGTRHHSYFQCKLRVEPEQLSILGNLHVHYQYAIDHRAILANPE